MEVLNPAIAEKREQERRIEGIECEVKSMRDDLKEILHRLAGGA